MICQELSSLASERVNAVVFVIGNDVYAIEQAVVDITAFQTGDFAPFDVIPPWDYLALATAFGAKGLDPVSPVLDGDGTGTTEPEDYVTTT